MKKIIAVGGVPGTGKTTLFREFMKSHEWEKCEPVKLVNALYCKELDTYILGKYEAGEVFAGTDRLSMAVQPAAQEFISTTTSNVMFEGDRLTNGKFYDFILEIKDASVNIIILTAVQNILTERYEDRGSDQSETFLKGRDTKIGNILSNFDYMDYTKIFLNETLEDQAVVLDYINGIFEES